MRSTLLSLAIVLLATNASAAVKVGEISSARPDALPALRKAVEEEVARMKVTAKRDAIVSVSLVKLDHGACVISAVLRDKGGAMFAMLEGRAQAGGAVETAALQAAVHGAISRIPDALR
jgi:hypothetical protein